MFRSSLLHLINFANMVFFYFIFVRKVSPVLTSANPHHFLLRKTGPGLTSVPIFLHFIQDTITVLGEEGESPSALYLKVLMADQIINKTG